MLDVSLEYNFIKNKVQSGEIIIIDKVHQQCSFISKGIILKELDFLDDKDFKKASKIPYNTELTIAPNTKKFFHLLNSVFVNSVVKKAKNITEVEFEILKIKYNRFDYATQTSKLFKIKNRAIEDYITELTYVKTYVDKFQLL